MVDTSGMKRLVLNTEQLYEAERNGGENIFSASHLFLQTPKNYEINLEGFNSNYIYFDNEVIFGLEAILVTHTRVVAKMMTKCFIVTNN